MLINGTPGNNISIHDRGLLYGDGVFRTLRMHEGKPQHWLRHYRKLHQDCAALNLVCPESELLSDELQHLSRELPYAIAKIIITRGQGRRGYAPTPGTSPTRILSLTPAPDYPDHFCTQGIRLHICKLRLAHQPRLAGIKHLNRLENVLAAAEWSDSDIAEGVLLDIAGNVIEGTRSNLFMVRDGELLTPDLSLCGVAGVQRERVMEWATAQGLPCRVGQLGLEELLSANEIFLVNSVIGLWPVRELAGRIWHHHTIAKQVQDSLSHAPD